ncbi:MAG: VCBS repeat-containing protein [Planctomycetes bacterium]|nr:VCBS repeat-containing protein [Planctomycetota bacterium]
MNSKHITTLSLLAAVLLSPGAFAQFDNTWVNFTPGTGRIKDANGADASYILNDAQEKDFAAGDLNMDGWTDLVVMRKQPYTTGGMYPNYLLMNEGGILVDRSAQYASDTDVPGDLGFLTATNDRDVVIADVNLDGWPDVITCTTLGDGLPHAISHPRVYINKGSINGVWQGLRFEDARMPTFSIAPHFCGVAAGDVNGDGAPDLYFADYGNLSDKLLINNGNGFFTDSGTTLIGAAMLDAAFGSAANILDMTGDGWNDIVRSSGVTGLGAGPMASIATNDPNNHGHFPTLLYQSNEGSGATYHVDAGDLNRDGRPDIITSDDGADSYRYNLGTDGLGRPIWGALHFYSFVTGADDGFGGSCHIVDLDGDGWPDTIHADVDVDIGGCGRRAHIYHNLGGAIGGEVVLKEEAGSATGAWRGVQGMTANDLTGTFDVATLDLDNDGDLDMVFGRCNGTFVWMNQKVTTPTASTYAYGSTNVNSSGQKGSMSASGTPGTTLNDFVLRAEGLPPLKTTIFLYGTTRLWSPVPFGDGQRWTAGPIQRLPAVTSDASGTAMFPCDFTANPLATIQIGAERDVQAWFRDPPAGAGHSNTTNALAFWRVD